MKVVTVHRGARDGYQVASALSESGLLEALVTDLYWPSDRDWARLVERSCPGRVAKALRCRYAEGLPSRSVTSCFGSGAASLALSKLRSIPFAWQRDAVRWCDATLGHYAGRLANERGAALLSYSYYGHSAFARYQGSAPRMLFQLHPHPSSVRDILRREREQHPDCASSLDKEWELALPEEDFERLTEESRLADEWLVASSFTKQTLISSGASAERIHVIPYGIDLARFAPRKGKAISRGPLQLLFVGTLGQRKGIKYLLEAVDLLPEGSVELTVCGRPVDDLSLFRNRKTRIRLRPSVSGQELLQAYQQADIFVFPSVAEGFAQVILEAMASALPVISTTHTAAPDLIRPYREGLIIPPSNTLELVHSIEYFLRHRETIASMSEAARLRASEFTWGRFRRQLASVVRRVVQGHPAREAESCLSF